MQFSNINYFIFLIVVFFAFWLTKPKWRTGLLAIVSVIFYVQAGAKPLILLAAVAFLDFFVARQIYRTEENRKRKILLCTSLFIDLGILCFFKYANFFIESGGSLLAMTGFKFNPTFLQILQPLGLSFFIFQSIAYVVDVYRKTTSPSKSLIEYFAYLSFFPSIVAGPINRAKHLLPQFRNSLPLTSEQGGQALFLIAIGLIKKIAIADYLRANFVDRVFDFPERYSSLEMLAGIYGYAVQIYADFSGYSDVAIGSALLLGIALPINFNAPYRAQDLPEFWRRWHITLSTWLRDYVFFSITKLRPRSTAVLYSGLIATMMIGGLWHGAAWTFVIWGLLHGLGLVVARKFESFRKRWNWYQPNSIVCRIFGVFVTFHFVCLSWIFFRAENFSNAKEVFKTLFARTANTANLPTPILVIIALTLAAQWLPENWWQRLQGGFDWLPAPVQAALLAGLAMGLYQIASSDVVPFIYAKF